MFTEQSMKIVDILGSIYKQYIKQWKCVPKQKAQLGKQTEGSS